MPKVSSLRTASLYTRACMAFGISPPLRRPQGQEREAGGRRYLQPQQPSFLPSSSNGVISSATSPVEPGAASIEDVCSILGLLDPLPFSLLEIPLPDISTKSQNCLCLSENIICGSPLLSLPRTYINERIAAEADLVRTIPFRRKQAHSQSETRPAGFLIGHRRVEHPPNSKLSILWQRSPTFPTSLPNTDSYFGTESEPTT